MSTALNNESYNIRTKYVIRTDDEWRNLFSNNIPNLGEIIIIGTKNDDDDDYTASNYKVGDGITSYEGLESLDINTLHQGGGKTDTIKLANDVYFSTSVGNIPKGTTIQAGETLNYLLQKIANNNTLIDPSVTLTINPISAEVGKGVNITLRLTPNKGSYSNDGEFSNYEFFKDNTKITSSHTIQPVTDGTITFKGQANFKNETYSDTKTFTGFRYAFAGSTTATALTSDIIRDSTAKKSSKASMSTEDNALGFTALRGAKKIFFAYPSAWDSVDSKKPYFEMFGLAWAENNSFVKEENKIQVADARGNIDGILQNPANYTIYSWTPVNPLSAETTEFRVWFKQ